MLQLKAGYGYEERKHLSTSFHLGRGSGRTVRERRRSGYCSPKCLITTCASTPDSAAPRPCNIIVLPVLFEGSVRAVIELASFSPFSVIHQAFLDQLIESIGVVLNTIEANTLTENLLKQSQIPDRRTPGSARGTSRVQ